MRKLIISLAIMATIAMTLPAVSQDEPEKKLTVREVFVPTGEMGALLEQCKDRVLLTRDEFETLLVESLHQKGTEPELGMPVPLVFLSSDLETVVQGEQATVKAVLQWESYLDKLQAVPLDFEAVAIQSATINGEPAALGYMPQTSEKMSENPNNNSNDSNNVKRCMVFLKGKGRHRLELELTTPLAIDSVRQELAFHIPQAPKATETLVVPGDVELKSGAMIVNRNVEGEAASRVTRFELLPSGEKRHFVLTLNSHRTRMIKSVLAKSVQFAEVTEHYEKLHATFSLDVLHQPVGTAEFVVPESFEMTGVVSPQLARWSVMEREGRSILEVRFREPVSGQVPLNLTAVHFFDQDKKTDTLLEWAFPAFVPLEVSGYSAVFGLLLDTDWNVHQLDATHLIAISPQILSSTIPDSVFEASAGAPAVRTVAAWYAPNPEKGSIVCEFLKPEPAFDVVSHQVLTLNDREQTLRGLFQVAPRHEKLFELKLNVPQYWTVKRVTDASDAPLVFEQKGEHVQIKVQSGIASGTIFPIFFEASGDTPGWFGAWREQTLAFPRCCLVDAASDSGTIAVDVENDMTVTSENDVRLVPLDNKERTEFLAGVPTDLAFRYLSQPYSTDLTIARATPRLTARTYSFFRFAPSLLSAHYELHDTVEQAKTKSLSFLLPPDTPENIGINGLNGVAIKDYVNSKVTVNGKEYRKWDVQLAEPAIGSVVLGVSFEQAMHEETTQSLPMLTAGDVAWQSGLVSVEGHEELNLSVLADAEIRQVDVGELAATQYIPGRRLLGVYERGNDRNMLKVDVRRNPDYRLPSSLVQWANGEVEIAADGKRITRMTFELKTRATFLKIDLAEQDEIWGVSLDGETIKPQKSGSAILVDIPARNDAVIRRLEIIWVSKDESRAARIFSDADIRHPDLMIPQNADAKQTESVKKDEDKNKASRENAIVWTKIPVTRIAWSVTAPPGYEVTRIGDQTLDRKTPRPLLIRCLRGMFGSSNSSLQRQTFGRPWGGFGCSASPKSAAKPSASSHYLGDDVQYEVASEASADSAPARDLAYRAPVQEMSKKSDKRSYTREEQLIESQQQAGKRGFVGREGLPQSPVVPYQNQTLQTVRPVQVQFQKNLSAPLQRHLQFQMIGGGETRLNVQMVNTRLITFGFYLVWGGIMCAGLCLLNTNRKTRMIFVFAVMLAGTLLVLVPQLELFAPLCDEAVKAAFWVLVIYLLAWGIRKVRGKARSTERRARSMECKAQSVPSASTTSIVVILLASVIFSGIVRADDAADKTPVALPDGVIVAFYDADSVLAAPLLKDGLPDPNVLSQGNQKLLVPYSKYVELWNLVHSETKVETPEKPPVDYVMTFGGYKAMLAASDELSVTGHAEMELLVDQPVLFPLPVRQGILTSLNVDGKNAEATISKQNGAEASGLPDGVFVVQMHGKGKHKIDFTVKFKVERQGGWRLAAGRLPEFPASKVLLELPEERMELRCNDVFAQQKWQAETAGETVETSLGRGGEFRWSWRSKVTEAEIDQSLTADSEIRFNIREDSLVFDWDLTLSFRRGKHESFRVRIPSDYLVVSVNGENVRGWENIESGSPDSASAGSASAEGALIEVELLHAAQESEQFHLTLMKNADLVEAKNTTVLTPNVSVVGAAMHHGRITLQNSPRLEIKPSDVSNLSMTDMPDAKQPVATQNPARNPVAENPLGLTAFRAYRFTTENYQLPLVVGINQQMPDHMINNIVKLSIHEVKLESNCQLRLGTNSEDRFTERLILPAGLRPDSVSSQQPIEWSTKPLESGETELTVLWAVIPNNRNLVFNVMGTKPRLPDEKFDLPILLPQTHENVAQYFVIQTDPAFDAGLDETNNFTTMGNTVPNWITPEQRSLCRLQLFASTSGELFRKVSAKLTLIPREPVVTVESITNMQVNSQSVEESVLLDFNIQNAGIRSVQFEIPKRMADARIDAPLLQRKELKESENGETVLVTLLLQDEIMNEFRVLIRNNRELVSGKHYDATIPKIRTGRVLNQYVVLENAGSLDELQIGDGKDGGKPVNMRKISRQHKEWGNLAAILGGNATEAYLAAGDNAAGDNAAGDNAAGDDPRLEFSMVRRETVKMSGARIGLAETRIVLDENGDYLAEQIYRIDNKTEQFLDLKLPAGAELWVVRILTNQEWDARQAGASGDFGQPVKPTTLGKESPVVDESPIHGVQSVKAATHVRIPIIKTEVGDLDYIVRVVYAGKCGKIQWLSKLDMPFIEVLNIPVAASYASLQLPEQYKFQFDGTMSKVDQAVVSRTVSQYEAQKIADLKQTAQTGSPYEQARAISNLSLKGIVPSSSDYTVAKPVYETRQGRQYNQAQSGRRPGFETQQFDTQQQQIAGTPVYTNNAMPTASNSMQLEQRFASQNMARGKNVVVQSENNWKPGENENRDFAPNQSNNPKFAGWLSKNGLENPQTNDASKKESDEKMSGEHYARDLIRPETEKGEVAESNRENASRNPENYSRSRLLGEDRQQQAMTSNSSLKNQERLNDQQLASKLSTNRSSFADDSKGNTSGQSVFAFDMKYMQSASERQTNLPQEQTKNVDLYRQRLAVQNSSQSSVQQGTPTPVVSESLPTQSVRPPAGTAMPSSGMGSGMGMAAGSMPGSSGMSGIGSGSGMGMSGSGGRSSSTRRSGETPAPMPTPSATPALELAGGPAAAEPCSPATPTSDLQNKELGYGAFVMTPPMATKYTSLDIEIPQTGRIYLFTAPQSDIRLSVSGISTATSQRLNDFVYTSGLFAVCALTGFLVIRRKR